MAKILGSKCKLCRRSGEKLFLKGDRCATPKCAMIRKPYAPGIHGNKGAGRKKAMSEYGQQLSQKQKVKKLYGISEKQLRKHFAEAKKSKGVLGDNLILRLETRIDNVIYRLKLADSRAQARQIISHKLLLLNGRSFNIPSAKVKVGDVLRVKEAKKENSYFKNLQAILKKNSEVPSWLSLDPTILEGKILANPSKDDVGVNFDVRGIIEFYSR